MDRVVFLRNPESPAVHSSPSTVTRGGKSSETRLNQVAEDFETIFVQRMLHEMMKSQAGDGLFGSGSEGEFYEGILENAVARQIAHRQHLGLAEMVLRQLDRDKPGAGGSVAQPVPDAKSIARSSAGDLSALVRHAAEDNQVDPDLVQAVILHESGGDPRAVSEKGAIGLMQLMPETAREMGVDNRYDPVENINGGTRYLAQLFDRFAGDPELALAAYNAGPAAVDRYGGIPPFEENRGYVARVLATWRSFKQEGS
jgi:Rod binding domain-containing protein